MPKESFQSQQSPAKKVENLDVNSKQTIDFKQDEAIKQKALEALKQKVAIIDARHLAEMEARDAANAHMTEDKGKVGFWKKFWKHSLFESHYRNKKLNEIREEINKTGNIYTAVEQDAKAHENAMNNIATRFISEYEEVINKTAGEAREKLDSADAKTLKTKADIKKLIIDYASSASMSEEVFKSEKTKIFNSIDHDLVKGSETYADNLFEMAKNAKLAVEHGAKLNELDLDFDIIVGKAKSSIKTEARNNAVDKAVTWIKDTKVGRYVNPAVMSTALGIVFSIGVFAGKKTLSSKLSHAMTFGGTAVASGLLAGANESQRLAHERMQHNREMAKGGVIEKDSPRREEMEKYTYNTESANKLMSVLSESLYTKDAEGKEVAKQLTQAEFDKVMANITEIETRESFSNRNLDKKKIDLITYSNAKNVEKEHTEMVILLARAKDEIRTQLANNLKGILKPGESFDTILAKQVEVSEKVLLEGEKGITKQDKAFRNMKLKRSALVAGKAVLIGATVGAVIQEGVAAADGLWGGTREGIFEGFAHHGGDTTNYVQTPLDHLRSMLTGQNAHIPGGAGVDQLIGGGHFRLPDGANIISNPDGSGTYNITLGDRVISDHIELNMNPDGSLDQTSIDRLGEDGILASVDSHAIQGAGDTVVSANEYVNGNLDHTTRITRDGWYDNDTPKPIFDKNELKLHWGGENNTGIQDGKYIFNVARMTEGGSFHDNLSVDAQEKLKHGGLKMFLSLTRDTQMTPFEVDIDANGNAIIDPDSEVGKLFFSTDANGHAVFQGRFAEVSETFGTDADGRLHVRELATYEGPDHGPITIPGTKDIPGNILDLPLDTDPPIFIPFVPRTPLEPIFYKPPFNKNEPANTSTYDIVPTYYNGASLNQIQKEFVERGIEYDSYKMIELQDGRKIWVDKNNKEVSRDKIRERARLLAYLEKQNKEYLEELKSFNSNLEPMKKECRVSVIIPARFEEKNLKNLLDQYVKQVDEKGNPINKDLFEINIIVNTKEGEKADKSIDIINEWKAVNPGYHVNAIDKVFSKENANVGMARKYITDLSIMRSTERGESEGPLYIESEDADLVSVDKRTIAKLIKGFDEKPHLDVLRGIQDRQPEVMSKNDLFFFERRLWDFGEMTMRDESLRSDKFDKSSFTWNRVISGGWNTAYTAEAYAQIGGYVPDIIGEDMKIGQKISVLRGDEGQYNTYTSDTSGLRANSSPRRFLDAMAKQESPYDNFEDQSVKEKTLDELLGKLDSYKSISPEHKSRYEAGINTLFRFMTQEMGVNAESKKTMTRTLMFLGLKKGSSFDYVIDKNNEIKITDKGFDKVGGLLSKYKEEERWKLGYKRQNSLINEDVSLLNKEVEKAKGSIRENSALTKEFISLTLDNPELEETYSKGIERYYSVKNYKNLSATDPDREYLDKTYKEYLLVSGNEDKDMNTFLRNLIILMEVEFAKQMRIIKSEK